VGAGIIAVIEGGHASLVARWESRRYGYDPVAKHPNPANSSAQTVAIIFEGLNAGAGTVGYGLLAGDEGAGKRSTP
jgi:hypothetical protein